MSTVEVLFFAADPNSSPQNGNAARLLLDEEARQVREKVRAAANRDHLVFEPWLAVRTDDLLQALRERRPQVVHFSGHGGNGGLIMVGKDGRPHTVPANALARLFTTFRGNIRLVVLNACYSEPQAKAIAEAVGCAIGTRGPISDAAAISFAATFYSGIAFGESVQDAYDRAATLLALDRISDDECPELVVRDDIDPSQLILVPGAKKRTRKRATPPPASAAANPEPPIIDLQSQELGSAGSAPLSATGPTRHPSPGWGTVAPAARQVGDNLGLMSAPPPEGGTRIDLHLPTPRRGRERGFIAAVWALSLAGAMLLGGSFFWALMLSLPPLLVTAGFLRYAHASSGAMRSGPAAVVAVITSAGVVLGGASLVTDGHSHDLKLAVCATSEPPRTLGLLGSAGVLGEAMAHRQAGEHEAAFSAFYSAADAGDPQAMSYVGTAYMCGEGTERNLDSARHWLRRAADRNDARAMFALGVAHETGQGFSGVNAYHATNWYRKSADRGYADAMRSLGSLFHRGGHLDSALVWFEKAAALGSLDALVDAGHIYEEGRLAGGAAPDSALHRYHTAAERGSARGMLAMGRLYQEGIGVTRDYGEARRWYELGAAAGSADASNNLGVLYQNGWGVPQSRDSAIQLYREAAAAGSAEAKGNLAALEGGWRAWLRRWF